MAAEVTTEFLEDDLFIHCLDALSGLALLCAIWTAPSEAKINEKIKIKVKNGNEK